MKALWFSNVDIAINKMKGSGSWVLAMANALSSNFDYIRIINISFAEKSLIKSTNDGKITQIYISKRFSKNTVRERVIEIIEKEKPDIIHVWGTESIWSRCKYIYDFCPVLVDMQGILSSIVDNFYAGLTIIERIKCFGIKEFLKPTSSLPFCKFRYKRMSYSEKKIIECLPYISVQSNWIQNYILTINPLCEVLRTSIVLRPEFYQANKWQSNVRNVILSTATMVTPLKGLHLLLKALKIIKQSIPDIQLRLAGGIQEGLRKGGYARYILSLIKQYNLDANVVFLGELDTEALISEYQNASVFVNPSYIESYSLVVAEAMYIGIPVVASYVGGMSELGEDNKSILYFPKEDYVACAHRILKLLLDKKLSENISLNSHTLAHIRNSAVSASKTQMDIYNYIIAKK